MATDPGLGIAQELMSPKVVVSHVLRECEWDIMLIVVLCALSVVLILLWLLAVLGYVRRCRAY